MKAMIFSAGLGTRLRPYTNDRPKALAQIDGTPLLAIQLRRLQHFGFTDVVVNVHHYADMVEDFLRSYPTGDLNIHISDERDLLLDTGGGLLKAQSFLQGSAPIFLCNVDVLSDLNPYDLFEAHLRAKALATLAVMDRPSSRMLCWDKEMRLTGWTNQATGDTKGHPSPQDRLLAFSGLHIISPDIFPLITRTGVFSIIDLYLDLAPTQPIYALDTTHTLWLDVGKPAELERAHTLLPKILP